MTVKLEVFNDLDQLYKRAIEIFDEQLKKGSKTFGLATGGTMIPLYERIRSSDMDFSNCESVNLDEYVKLPKTHPESYWSFMTTQLFQTKPFKKSYLPNGEATDTAIEAKRYEELLKSKTLDFQLLGVGVNGHIGFNEPGTSFESETHVVKLSASTRKANARFFHTIEEVPTQAITMGIASIMRAHKILLIAVGEEKRTAIQALMNGDMTKEIPVTVLKEHNDVIVLTDLVL